MILFASSIILSLSIWYLYFVEIFVLSWSFFIIGIYILLSRIKIKNEFLYPINCDKYLYILIFFWSFFYFVSYIVPVNFDSFLIKIMNIRYTFIFLSLVIFLAFFIFRNLAHKNSLLYRKNKKMCSTVFNNGIKLKHMGTFSLIFALILMGVYWYTGNIKLLEIGAFLSGLSYLILFINGLWNRGN